MLNEWKKKRKEKKKFVECVCYKYKRIIALITQIHTTFKQKTHIHNKNSKNKKLHTHKTEIIINDIVLLEQLCGVYYSSTFCLKM